MKVTSQFLLAGDATFTIQTPDQGHRTYRITATEPNERYPKPAYFVKLLTGADNTSDYSYVGKLDTYTFQVMPTAKSQLSASSYPVRLFNRVMARIACDDHAAFESKGFKVHHEGKCGRCGKKLTTPESIERGFGPECIKAVNQDRLAELIRLNGERDLTEDEHKEIAELS
jgi:hypothetical protein